MYINYLGGKIGFVEKTDALCVGLFTVCKLNFSPRLGEIERGSIIRKLLFYYHPYPLLN